MSALSGLISGGGGGGNNGVLVFSESTTFTPTRTVDALVFVIGAGGSGSVSKQRNGTIEINSVGGGAGGCAVSQLTLESGTTYTVTVGAGGAEKSVVQTSGTPSNLVGEDGGTSSFSGSGITTMTATGGKGGLVSATAQAAIVASDGGTATGGNIVNSTGGAAAASPSGVYYTSGGGSVGIWEDGRDGESIFLAVGSLSLVLTERFTIGNPLDFQITSPQDIRNFVPEVGASGYDYATAGSDVFTLGNSGAFAGGLAGLYRDTADGYSGNAGVRSGDGGIGAGGGGATGYGTATSGAGGNGIVIIKILDVL